MKPAVTLPSMYPSELEDLLQALRRDRQAEEDKAAQARTAADREYHGFNAHRDVSLLQRLNPKGGKHE